MVGRGELDQELPELGDALRFLSGQAKNELVHTQFR
jgi:hypothetical protein